MVWVPVIDSIFNVYIIYCHVCTNDILETSVNMKLRAMYEGQAQLLLQRYIYLRHKSI